MKYQFCSNWYFYFSEMMIRVIFSILFLTITYNSQSQIIIGLLFGKKLNNDKLKFGVNVGLNYGTINSFKTDYSKIGLNLGLFLDIKLTDDLILSPEFFAINETGGRNIPKYSIDNGVIDMALNEASVKRTLKYISLPVILKYNIYKGIRLNIGPQFSYLTKAQDVFFKSIESGDVIFRNNIKSQYNKFDFGGIIGVEYALLEGKGMSFSLRYFQGFIEASKSKNTINRSQYNQIIQFTTSIPVGSK
ncbi:MAG: porin family protein [Salibacteraceae bacterium]